MVPLTTKLLTIDYIAQENYPLIFVTSGKLGSINHTLLSLEAIQKRGIVLDTVLYNMYPTVEDKTIQNDTMNFIRTWLEKHFPETKFILVPPFQFFSSATASISTSAPWCSARVGTTTRAGLWLPKKAA